LPNTPESENYTVAPGIGDPVRSNYRRGFDNTVFDNPTLKGREYSTREWYYDNNKRGSGTIDTRR
jgi:hypothetical protein